MKATIYDIAKKAGVSKSTVSRVLNNQPDISDKTKEKVVAAIKELNYAPSKIARGLSGSGFDAILVTSRRSSNTTLGNPFFSEIIQTISAVSEDNQFDLILQTAKTAEEELDKCLKKIKENMIKGIIILSSAVNEEFLSQLDLYEIPVVVIGRIDHTYKNVHSVDTDNYNDSYQLVKKLIDLGHIHIGCLHAPTNTHVSSDRVNGYRQCLFDHQLDIRNEWIIDGGYTVQESEAALKKAFTLPERPTAFFSTDALRSLSLYNVVKQTESQVPERLSIAGFSDQTFSPFFSPPLTRVDIPIYELGIAASKLLFRLINNEKIEEKNTLIPTEIVFTNSIKRIKQS